MQVKDENQLHSIRLIAQRVHPDAHSEMTLIYHKQKTSSSISLNKLNFWDSESESEVPYYKGWQDSRGSGRFWIFRNQYSIPHNQSSMRWHAERVINASYVG